MLNKKFFLTNFSDFGRSLHNDECSKAKRRKWSDVFGEVTDSLSQLIDSSANDVANKFKSLMCYLQHGRNELDNEKIKKIKELNSKKTNLLMKASKLGNLEAVKFLIEIGLNSSLKDESGLTATDYAVLNDRIDCLYELLNADSPWPAEFIGSEKFETMEKTMKDKIAEIIRQQESLHESIRKGENDKLEKFVKENPKYKFAYDENNQCALTTALVAKQAWIYSFLRSKGFAAGYDRSKYMKVFRGLDKETQALIGKENKKYFKKTLKNHIMELLSKSKLGFGTESNFSDKLIDYFEKLDAISEISPILEIAASHEDTDIVFDFKLKHVKDLNPILSEGTKGVTYHTGHILISAGRSDPEVLATIAHELTHWSMQLVYNDKCRPFFGPDDDCRKPQIEKIAREYNSYAKKSKSDVISAVYTNYPPEKYVNELIVRVPHLLALHVNEPKIIEQLKVEFKELFDFFNDIVLKDIRQELTSLDDKQIIKKINRKLLVFANAKQSNFLSSEHLKDFDFKPNQFIASSVPKLVLEHILRFKLKNTTREVDSVNIFVKLYQIDENFEELIKVASSAVNPTFFILNSKESFNESIGNKLHRLLKTVSNMVFISSKNENLFGKMKLIREGLFLQSLDFNWKDLNLSAKMTIKNSQVLFQGSKVTLDDISTDKLLEELPSEFFFKPSTLKLQSQVLPEPPRVFIDRKFESVSQGSLDNLGILEQVKNEEIVILSAETGIGKSALAVQLARDSKLKNPLIWVVFIDLKFHTKVFKAKYEVEKIYGKFFSQEFLKLDSTSKDKVFSHMYDKGKVFFIMDGFDEISPDYTKSVMKILRTVKNSDNHLLVTTRPFCAERLETELQRKVISMEPSTNKDQIKFLTKLWQHKTSRLKYRIWFAF